MSNSDPGLQFQRSNLIVRDLDRSLEIYRDILGFSIDYQKVSEKTSYSYTVFGIPAHAKLRFCTLSAPGQLRTLALTEVTGVELPEAPSTPRLSAMVLKVDAMDAVLEAFRARGDMLLHPEQVLHTQDGRVGREIGVVDPDGHLLVLYTITRAGG
ncbi:MAG: VOC family protein [Gammaproteobacteria bacterium]|nr:VOC family protein [Gammaproteobacteria bacterium]